MFRDFERRDGTVDNLAHDLERIHDTQLVGPTGMAVHGTLQADNYGIGTVVALRDVAGLMPARAAGA